MRFKDLGCISFEAALTKQEQTVAAVADGLEDETVFLLEHPHVFTCGRGGDAANLLASVDWNENPIELVRINRGGDVTYHGPGQLVGYPHLDLKRRSRDVHRYLRDLEASLMATAARFGVPSFRREGLTGVWTERGKLASIGVGVRRWVTMHGFALNVSTDLRYFQLINPCGMPDCPMVSLSSLTGCDIEMAAVKQVFAEEFERVFGLTEPGA
ncbi:MAG: lipoyl(octanoyl) transferase LipB [Acidobacteria bacterium]|nr:MAG: lipoyl(octanoyl) transferase LipB [Acidobacteriota bacterium]